MAQVGVGITGWRCRGIACRRGCITDRLQAFNITAFVNLYNIRLTVDFDGVSLRIVTATDNFITGRHWFKRLWRSEEYTSELQSRPHLVCRLLLEKKK